MTKYLRGDLLILTNKGIKRVDKLEKTDLIVSISDDKPYFEEIEDINKEFLKKYKLNKIKLSNSIENYYLNDNVKIKVLQNIPTNVHINQIPDYLDENKHRCITTTTVSNLTDFDYIGFPIFDDYNYSGTDNYNETDDDYYRFQGLLLNYDETSYNLNNINNEKTIGFLTKYLHNNNIKYEITNDNIKTVITFDKKTISKITFEDILKLKKINLYYLFKGLTEVNKQITTNNKNLYFIIKYIALTFGILISSNFINDKLVIKIPEINDIKYNYIVYDNYIWNKIKYISKIDCVKCNLFSLTLKNNKPYLTDTGVIS